MKFKKTTMKIILVLVITLLGIAAYSLKKDRQERKSEVPYTFMQSNNIMMILDARIELDKAYNVVVTTYDHPSRLMNESYIEIYDLDWNLLKAQYFNGNPK